MIDLKMTPFMKIAAVVGITMLICFVFAASAIMFANPEYTEMAKRIIVIAAGAGLFFAVLLIVLNIVELVFAGTVAVLFGIGVVIKEVWKKLTSDDVLGGK